MQDSNQVFSFVLKLQTFCTWRKFGMTIQFKLRLKGMLKFNVKKINNKFCILNLIYKSIIIIFNSLFRSIRENLVKNKIQILQTL